MSEDHNFDPLFERFRRRIKGSTKGRLREFFIREDLAAVLDGFETPVSVLDAGCGLGDMSVWLASHGHRVSASDISRKMVDHTRTLAASSDVAVDVHERSLQAALTAGERYHLICLHAVLEWLAEPWTILPLVPSCLTAGGVLSLTVFNWHRSLLNTVAKGNFTKAMAGTLGESDRRSISPPQPMDPLAVARELQALGFVIEVQAGLRCFYDDLLPAVKGQRSFEDIVAVERQFRHQRPYRDLARYVHFVARWQGSPPVSHRPPDARPPCLP